MSTLKSDPVAIVLAAGDSERMGEDKLLLMHGKKRIIEHTLASHRKARRVQDIVLVVRPGMADAFEPLRSARLHIVENPDPSGGMITSIRAGLGSSWAQERNFLIAPGDVPFVPPTVVDQIVTEFVTRRCRILIPTYKGLGGHPGMFDKSLRDDFFLHGDARGTREILFRYREDTVRLHLHEPDVCFDIDTPAHLAMAADPGARWADVMDRVEAKRSTGRGAS